MPTVMAREFSWLQLVAAPVSAVVVPLILHRIFFHKKVRHSSSAGSGSLEEYMTTVGGHPSTLSEVWIAISPPLRFRSDDVPIRVFFRLMLAWDE